MPDPGHNAAAVMLPRPRWRTVLMGSAAALGMILASLDFSVNVALPAIRDAFDTDLASVQWVIVVFIATRAGLALGAGAFADRFGLRVVYLFGTVTYLIAMLCLTLSPTLEVMVGFRVLQALGTGCLYSTAPAIAAFIFPNHRRGLSMGFTSASLAFGMVASTLAAGPLVQIYGWQAVYAGRVPLTALALAAGLLAVPGRLSPQASNRRFDILGAALVLALLLCLIIGLRLGQSIGWTSPIVIALLAADSRCVGGADQDRNPRPITRVAGRVVATPGLSDRHVRDVPGAFLPVRNLVHLPLLHHRFAEPRARYPGHHAGDLVRLQHRIRPNRRLALRPVGCASGRSALGLTSVAVGLFAMSALNSDSAIWHPAATIAMVGLGVGWFQSAAYALMLGSVPADRYGTASGAMSLAQASGTVFCVAVVGAIFAALGDQYALSSAIDPDQAFLLAYRDAFRIGATTAVIGAGLFAVFARQPQRGISPQSLSTEEKG